MPMSCRLMMMKKLRLLTPHRWYLFLIVMRKCMHLTQITNVCICFIVKDGSQVRFWEDRWLGNITLREQYPQLYNIARKKYDTVADVLSTQISNISWQRDLIGNKLISWNNLLSRLEGIELRQERDEFRWNLDQSGVFSVKSHYLGLIHQDTPNLIRNSGN